MFLFSILIANYNNSNYLYECINSALNQTYENIEIIFVDDGSTDNSVEIAEELAIKDKRIKIYKNSLNKGVGFTKRKMIELSNGEICGILDSDDYLHPEAVEKMIFAHQNQHTASIVYTSTVYFDKFGEIKGVYKKTIAQPVNKSIIDESQVSHFITFKKELYNKTIGINPYLKGAEDLDLFIILEEQGEILHFDEKLYFHRIHEGGISQGKNKDYMNDWAFMVKSNHLARRGQDIKPFFETYKNWYKYDLSVYSNFTLFKILLNRLFSFKK